MMAAKYAQLAKAAPDVQERDRLMGYARFYERLALQLEHTADTETTKTSTES
jgi:thiamine biosynthesis protein ThiC